MISFEEQMYGEAKLRHENFCPFVFSKYLECQCSGVFEKKKKEQKSWINLQEFDKSDERIDVREMFYDVIASYTLVNEKNMVKSYYEYDDSNGPCDNDDCFYENDETEDSYECYELGESDECIFCSDVDEIRDIGYEYISEIAVHDYGDVNYDRRNSIPSRETHPFSTVVELVGGSGRRGRGGRKHKLLREKVKQNVNVEKKLPYPYDFQNSRILPSNVSKSNNNIDRELASVHSHGYKQYALENAIKRDVYYSDEIRLSSSCDAFCVYDFNITNLLQFDAQIVESGVAICYGTARKYSKYRIGDVNLRFSFVVDNFTGSDPIYGFYYGQVKRPSDLLKNVEQVGNILRSSVGYGPFFPDIVRPKCKKSCVFSADSVKNFHEYNNDGDIGTFDVPPPIDKWVSFLFCDRRGGADRGSFSGVLTVEFVINLYIFPSLLEDLIDIIMNRYRDLEGLSDYVSLGEEIRSGDFFNKNTEAQDTPLISSIVHEDMQQQIDNLDRVEVDETREVKEVLVRFELMDKSLCQVIDNMHIGDTLCRNVAGCDIFQNDVDFILENVFNIRE